MRALRLGQVSHIKQVSFINTSTAIMSFYLLRPFVWIRLSNFGIVSRNYTDFCENEKTNISVHF